MTYFLSKTTVHLQKTIFFCLGYIYLQTALPRGCMITKCVQLKCHIAAHVKCTAQQRKEMTNPASSEDRIR